MLLMIKNITSVNYEKVFEKRMYAFSNALRLGQQITRLEWDSVLAQHAHIAITAAFDLREVFFTLLYTAANRAKHPYRPFFESVLTSFRYAECNHLTMINDYWMKRPALILLANVHDNDRTLNDAFAYMDSLGHRAPYVKLINPPSECVCISSRTLAPYRDVALCIARYRSPQFGNYIPDNYQARLNDTLSRVRNYLEIVDKYSVTSTLESKNTALSNIAKAMAIQASLPVAEFMDNEESSGVDGLTGQQ